MGNRRHRRAKGRGPGEARSRRGLGRAADQAKLEVVAALVPICIEQSNQDPQVGETLAQLRDASSYQRSDMLMKAGWATMPGSSDPNRNVAKACIERLSEHF
jgi:hypothetical protein